MKPKKLQLIILILIFPLSFGCDWIYNSPVLYNVDLYKTRGDYRHLYTINLSTNRLTDVYLSLTFKEIVIKEIAMNNPGHALPDDTLRKYILDKGPYLEFWRCTTTLELRDSVKINEIIRNGEIEKCFERLK